ncbi:hypothetical protein [Devosia sp.]|uniref:hypothetical protein n=1 Tax=Devosia sp. TaxID=1871048 RepID=UPI001B2F6EF8|nr:hypothetical protein [Devosia sp.]MBO9589586.1 hypothetical protein [Devosia sp.]
MAETLYIVRGFNLSEGAWTQYVIATSPGKAVDLATTRKPWDLSRPIEVELPTDFIDGRQALSEGEQND